jgi:hypothetical protein
LVIEDPISAIPAFLPMAAMSAIPAISAIPPEC